jgi:hypothetical protein
MSDSLPHATLTPLAKETASQKALALLIRELTANAMSVPSSRGDGTSGHYALVASEAAYLLDTGADFYPRSLNPSIFAQTPRHKSPKPTAKTLSTSRTFASSVPPKRSSNVSYWKRFHPPSQLN